ncbi:Rhomboid-like protein [gamma proteobacterium HdN1]|nr:Rhomboid-like protein [gamma proteobacterium HdN1]
MSFAHPRAAHAFGDYLTSLGIRNRIVGTDVGVQVLLLDEHYRAAFREEFQRFWDNPNDERYLAASWSVGSTEPVDYALLGRSAGRRSGGFALRRMGGVVTLSVLAICVVIFLEMQFGDPLGWRFLLHFFADFSAIVNSGEWWRWITPSLWHFQALHIAFNLLWWWELGGNVERHHGSVRLLILFVVFNVVSNFSQFWMSGPNFLGLSGVVYGLLGYLWIYAKLQPRYPEPMNPMIVRMMLIWLVVCMTGVLDGLMGGGVANAAHVGGLVAGMALGCCFGWLDGVGGRKGKVV